MWSSLSSSEGRVALQHADDLAVGGGDRRLPQLGEGVRRHEGGDLVADEALDRAREWDGEDLGPVGQGVLEDLLGVDELVDLVGQVGAQRRLHPGVIDQRAGPVAEVVGLEEAPAGEHAEACGQDQHTGEEDAEDGEHAPDAALAPLAGVEHLDLLGQRVALGLQGLDVRRRLVGRIDLGGDVLVAHAAYLRMSTPCPPGTCSRTQDGLPR